MCSKCNHPDDNTQPPVESGYYKFHGQNEDIPIHPNDDEWSDL